VQKKKQKDLDNMKKMIKKSLPKAQPGKEVKKEKKPIEVSKKVGEAIKVLQGGKESDYEKLGKLMRGLNKAQQDSVTTYQKSPIYIKKKGGTVKAKKK
jgi:hypothetical protein